MWKDYIRNIVVIFQTILRIVGFYVRRAAMVCYCKHEPYFASISFEVRQNDH